MTDPTIAGAPQGFNCRLSARGYGSRLIRVTQDAYDVQVGTQEDEAANFRALYLLNRTSPTFVVTAVFQSWDEREQFNQWAREYMQRVAANQPVSGYVYVEIPTRRFTRFGVLTGPLMYGAAMGDLSYPVDLMFVGAQEPVGSSAGSYYKAAPKDTTTAPYFYPSGNQVAGPESLAGTFYDPRPPAVVPPVAEPPPYQRPTRPGVPF